ncbi:hypothetical protein [Glycomyces terrestris]|uniref:DUF1772 domain-containing protein n=1 Tax=Glycomyces terrestris TaxID=2493553 RepID=A0A426UUR9_9ACTN|nr:hypothetical protein [Glycomyces terrestris]RRR97606.1 hypothetical protein EIW28_19665 [Glycomyces terrestris]
MAPPQLGPRARTVLAAVLLVFAATVIAVAVSQWLTGAGSDPRDDVLSRAAGIGFTDEARGTLFSILPVALPPFAAVLVPGTRPGRVIGGLARLVSVAYLVIGVLLALSAARYGFDDARQLAEEGQVFIDTRAAVERLVLDGVWLALAGIGLAFAVKARPRERNSTAEAVKQGPPQA